MSPEAAHSFPVETVVSGRIRVRIVAMRLESEAVLSFELRAEESDLPAAEPGAHIDVYLANGLIRSYSLCKAAPAGGAYVIAVGASDSSRGGSKYLREEMRVGQILDVSPPRNNFPLAGGAAPCVLIAGGIGITPVWSMVQALAEAQRPWTVYYSARSARRAAFTVALERLAQASGGKAHFSFGDDPLRARHDIPQIIAGASPETHFYCCGPAAMLEAFQTATEGLPREHVHMERFAAAGTIPLAEGEYTVECARSGKTLRIVPGQTILDAALAVGIDAPYSCREGVCGACETRLLEGVPEHRDLILSAGERASGKVMLICCSGAKSDRLVLDL